MAESNIQPVPELVIELGGEGGNIFEVLKKVSAHLSDHGYPPELIESLFDEVLSTTSYPGALTMVWAISGCKFTIHGKSLDYLTCGHKTATRLVNRGAVNWARRH